MTTTSFDDQFTVGTQTIVLHQAYDTVAILRRNVADLEVALRKQTERAEAAEAELAKLRKQEPVAWKHENGNLFLSWQKDLIVTGAKFSPLYTAPIPAPALPEEWRETLSKLVGIVESSTKFHGCDDVTKQARALLLQSAEVTDNAAGRRLLGGE